MEYDYNVFISAKGLDPAGKPTEDRDIAQALWEFLSNCGFRVFFSNVSLERMGVSAYTDAIDDALDRTKVVVVVCTSGAHANSQWVRYEWSSFLNDIRSGMKPDGHVFVYLVNESIRNLPRALRHTQCIEHEPDGFNKLARFISNATGQQLTANGKVEAVHPIPDPSPNHLDLGGEWEGEWKRDIGSILHRGRLFIEQNGHILTARMKVTFIKQGQPTILMESLHGLITAHSIILQGESFEYESHGLSKSYLLDHFELTFDIDGNTLKGDFYSKSGRGHASFKRI